MAQSQDKSMKNVLEKGGLDPDKWLEKFKQKTGATTKVALKECGKESFDSLKEFATTPLELKLLKKFLKMNPDKKIPEDEMKVILQKANLDPEKWFEEFKKQDICTPEALNRCGGKELYEKLKENAKTDFENKMLQEFLKFDPSSEKTAKTPNEEMSEILENAGLEPKYWLPKFKEAPLSITTPQALKQCGPESYKSLSKHAKTEFHEKTLKAFLGMNEKESEYRKLQKQEVQNQSEKLKQTITDLKTLRDNEKNRKDDAVKALEDGIRADLNVPPEKWISPKADINSLLTQLESYESKLSGEIKSRTDYESSKELIDQISNGRILRGLIPIQGIADPKESANLLLRSYDGLQVKGPTLDSDTKTETFTSVKQEDSYVKNIDKIALSASIAAKGGAVVAVEVSTSVSYTNETEEFNTTQEEKTYLSKVENTMVPLGCFTFSDIDLVLSSNAVTSLQKIEEMAGSEAVSESDLQMECETFFYKFGACANRGAFHLGGMYWLKSSSEGFKKDEMEELKKRHSVALSTSAGASYMSAVGASASASAAYATGHAEGKHKSDSKTTIKISRGQHGGPPEAFGMKLWKDGLMASDRTWQIIGNEMNMVNVWEIIKLNHSGDFKNVEKLSQLLSQTWEHLLQSSLNQTHQEYLQTTPEAVELREKVKLWLSSKKESDCLDNLNTLLELKQQLEDAHFWQEFYLNQTSIQCYLRWIVFIQKQKETQSDGVRYVMQKVVEYDKLVRIKNFYDRWYILGWLHPLTDESKAPSHEDIQCTDLTSFLAFLQITIADYHYREVRCSLKRLENGEITARLMNAVNMLYRSLPDTSYDSLLLVTLLLPLKYDVDSYYFKNDLTISHLDYLEKKVREYEPALSSSAKEPVLFQVRLFLLTLQSSIDTFDNTATELSDHIQYLHSKIENLDGSVEEALTECELNDSNRYNFRQLKIRLNEIITHKSQSHNDDDEPPDYETLPNVQPKPNNEVKPKDKKYEHFLKEVEFLNYFPQKLKLQEALTIDCDIDKYTETSDLKTLLWVMLQKLKMSNYNGRNVTNEIINSGNATITGDPFADAFANPFANPFKTPAKDIKPSPAVPTATTSGGDVSYTTTLIHPMDSLLALLHCSDNLLKQFLFQKLITAQLAVPLLAPDPVIEDLEVPLWSLRSIVRYWKSKTTKISQEARIVDLEIPLISFMRFSHPKTYSKSAMLNKLISQSFTHNFFYSIECNGSSAERKFANGIVEACWYLPSGKDFDHFDDVITFANLRGNAGSYSDQFAFLSFHSYMLYISLSEEDIQTYQETIKILDSTKGYVVFLMKYCSNTIESTQQTLKMLIPTCFNNEKCCIVWLTLPNGNVKQTSDLVKEIRELIKHTLAIKQESPPFCKLSACCDPSEITELGIRSDEKIDACQTGRELANEIMQEVKRFPPDQVKEYLVPLQSSNLWHEWASLDKTENRMKPDEMGEDGIEQFKKKKRDEKREIRKKQLSKIEKTNRSKVLSTFIDVLLYYTEDEGLVRMYFLQWLKFMLDDNSRQVLPSFKLKCKNTRKKLQEENLTVDEKTNFSEDLRKYDQELIHASFGVEHLFREIGQMYECIMDPEADSADKELIGEAKMLSKVAAHLFHSGYPLELIDGDAAHIPLNWVSAVLTLVNSYDKKAQITVLSVLGIQSTGKSTLLNTVYGAQFAVSAGRCTRGASCQLLKVKTEEVTNKLIQKEQPNKYMLIIDTEGLRAPELDSQQTQQHDNELATLVIGLAGATIVNISGEVPADIDDILQTSVHAFMRMKNVDLKPSCQFVRHNVVDAAAGNSNEGSQRFQQTLDKMTVIAAKAERCVGQYRLFKQVIAFDNSKDIQNFAGLWEGNPPMAPVNPAYCEDSVKLKSKIFEFFVSPDSFCTMQEFDLRVRNLWKSVLEENFLFSFKNTLEVEAYAKLDAEYGTKWSWRLQNLMLQWQSETRKFITSATNPNDVKSQICKIEVSLDNEYDSIMIDFKKFFGNNPNTYLAARMTQWRAVYERKLDNLRDDHKKSAPRFCQELITKELAKKKFESMQKTERDRINKRIKDLVAEMDIDKDKKLTDDDILEIEKKFNKSWDEWMAELKREYGDPEGSKIEIEQEILHCIKRRCGLEKEDSIINTEVSFYPIRDRGHPPLQLVLDQEKHINFGPFYAIKSITAALKREFRVDKVTAAKEFTKTTLSEIKSELDKAGESYSDTIISTVVVQAIRNKIVAFEKENGIEFTTLYLVVFVLELCGYAFRVFDKLQTEAIQNHPVKYLEGLRKSYETTFTALCTATAQEKASAMCLTDLVFKQVKPTLKENLTLQIANDVKSNNSIFDSKKKLKGQILLKLLNSTESRKQKYQLYDDYLRNIRKSYLHWIRKYVEEHCNTTKSGKRKVVILADKELSRLITRIVTATEKASEAVDELKHQKRKGKEKEKDEENNEVWIRTFHSHLAEVLQLNKQELLDITQLQPDCDLEFFHLEFIAGVKEKEKEYIESFQKPEESDILNLAMLIDDTGVIVRDNSAGCCEQCPFCKEQCDKTDKSHDGFKHSCSLHRPQCLGGYRYIGSEEMIIDICTSKVARNGRFRSSATNNEFVLYKNYQTYYPDWEIADESRGSAPYWKWFTAEYQDEIVESFKFKKVKLSDDWTCLRTSDAERDIKERYSIK